MTSVIGLQGVPESRNLLSLGSSQSTTLKQCCSYAIHLHLNLKIA